MTPSKFLDAATHRMRSTVLYVDGPHVIAARGPKVLESFDTGTTWRTLWCCPLDWRTRWMTHNRLSKRMFRAAVQHVRPLDEQHLCVVGFRRVYTIHTESRSIVSTQQLDFSRPLALCVDDGRAYYGEYSSNPKRRPVHVWGSEPGGTGWHPVWTFDNIRHVHGVYWDPVDDALWVTTGDTDAEAGIWRTTDRFRSLDLVLGGSQQSRVVQLLFGQDYIYYATDAPGEQNHIYALERATGRADRIAALPGPVFWGHQTGGCMFFSTVCEPSAVNETRRATVWHSRGDGWAELVAFPKDRWPMKLFQYGQVLFPAGPGDPKALWLSPFATAYDHWSFRVPLDTMA